MPAAYSHHRLALTVLKLYPDLDSDAFCLGSQGPDPFLYRGTLPWEKQVGTIALNDYGDRVHHANIYPLYSKMLSLAEDNVTQSYVKGLYLHYCLDSLAHPYIFYRSGFEEDGTLVGLTKFSHGKFEALLDAVLQRYDGVKQNPGKLFKLKDGDIADISHLWASLGEVKEKDFIDCYHDFNKTQSFLYSRTGLKRPLFYLIGPKGLAYGMSYPHFVKKADEGLDVLNLTHQEYLEPATGVSHTYSFLELLDLAKEKFVEIMGHIEDPALPRIIDFNIDHDGDPAGKRKLYSKPCFPFLTPKERKQ